MRAVLAGWAKCIYPHYIYEVQLNNYEKQSSLYLFIRSSSHHITCTFPLPNSTTPSGRFESLLSLLHPLVKLVSIGEKSSRLNWQSTAIWLFFWLFFFSFFFFGGCSVSLEMRIMGCPSGLSYLTERTLSLLHGMRKMASIIWLVSRSCVLPFGRIFWTDEKAMHLSLSTRRRPASASNRVSPPKTSSLPASCSSEVKVICSHTHTQKKASASTLVTVFTERD